MFGPTFLVLSSRVVPNYVVSHDWKGVRFLKPSMKVLIHQVMFLFYPKPFRGSHLTQNKGHVLTEATRPDMTCLADMAPTTSSSPHSPLPAKLAPSLFPAQAKFTLASRTHALPLPGTDLPSALCSNVISSVGHSLTTNPFKLVTTLPNPRGPTFLSALFLNVALITT